MSASGTRSSKLGDWSLAALPPLLLLLAWFALPRLIQYQAYKLPSISTVAQRVMEAARIMVGEAIEMQAGPPKP